MGSKPIRTAYARGPTGWAPDYESGLWEFESPRACSYMKICSKCNRRRHLTSFSFRKCSPDGRCARCKTCTRAASKEHYDGDPKYYTKKARRRDKTFRNWIKELKTGKACIKCGESHPACLVFHHKDPRKKLFELGSKAARYMSKKRIESEVAKCDLLCANCHCKEHWGEYHVAG